MKRWVRGTAGTVPGSDSNGACGASCVRGAGRGGERAHVVCRGQGRDGHLLQPAAPPRTSASQLRRTGSRARPRAAGPPGRVADAARRCELTLCDREGQPATYGFEGLRRRGRRRQRGRRTSRLSSCRREDPYGGTVAAHRPGHLGDVAEESPDRVHGACGQDLAHPHAGLRPAHERAVGGARCFRAAGSTQPHHPECACGWVAVRGWRAPSPALSAPRSSSPPRRDVLQRR